MKLLVQHIKWVMLTSGVITFTMISAFLFPESIVMAMFQSELSGDAANVIVRNWGALIALVGGMLIYGAFKAAVREYTMVVAALSKAIFIGLVIYFGFLQLMLVTVLFDTLVIVLFALYFVGVRQPSSAGKS